MSFLEHKECHASNTRNVFLRTQGMSCFEHKECLSSNTRNVMLRTQGMSSFEHNECPSSNTRNVLLRTQGMSFFEQEECRSSNTRNVLLRTQGMSFFEHKECPSSNTRNVLLRTLCHKEWRKCRRNFAQKFAWSQVLLNCLRRYKIETARFLRSYAETDITSMFVCSFGTTLSRLCKFLANFRSGAGAG